MCFVYLDGGEVKLLLVNDWNALLDIWEPVLGCWIREGGRENSIIYTAHKPLLPLLVRMVFLIHCLVTSTRGFPSTVKGVSNTNLEMLFSLSNLVFLSSSSLAVK